MSSEVTAMRRLRARSWGSVKVVTAIVAGSTFAILFVPKRFTNGTPRELSSMPYGRVSTPVFTRRMFPVLTLRWPMKFEFCAVNQMFPCASKVSVCGSRAAGLGIG